MIIIASRLLRKIIIQKMTCIFRFFRRPLFFIMPNVWNRQSNIQLLSISGSIQFYGYPNNNLVPIPLDSLPNSPFHSKPKLLIWIDRNFFSHILSYKRSFILFYYFYFCSYNIYRCSVYLYSFHILPISPKLTGDDINDVHIIMISYFLHAWKHIFW